MIYSQTRLNVADNSGAKIVYCIKVLGTNNGYAKVGDIIIVSVKSAIPTAKAGKGKIFKAVVVRTKSPFLRSNGMTIRFPDNAAVLINDNKQPLGTRVFGTIARELRENFLKIISLAEEVV